MLKSCVFIVCYITLFQNILCAQENKQETMQKTYTEFKNNARKIHTLSSMESLLSWDQQTLMPPGAADDRAMQLKLQSGTIHQEFTSDTNKRLLQQLIDLQTGRILFTSATEEQKANLKEWRRDLLHATKLPNAFVQEFAEITSKAQESWQKARNNNSFSQFQPDLEKVVELCRQKAEYLGYKDHPYNALLDLYEPDLTVQKLDALFSRLKPALIDLLQQIQKRPSINNSFLFQSYSKTDQWDLAHKIMEVMTIEKRYTRLNESAHPFTSAISPPHDVRITTKIEENNLSTNLFAVLHEGGHALYCLGLPEKYIGTPLGESVSTAIHESQSRLWETIIGQSYPFWEFFYKTLQTMFPLQLQEIDLEHFYQAINKVDPSFIRIRSDEVCYCLHIILRYEIEKALFEKSIEVADIPRIWNKKMEEYLGILPPSEDLGCLQDIHWSFGDFGYFPSYALGNMYAAQIFDTFKREHPEWEQHLISGDLHQLRNWLQTKIHRQGRFYTPDELIKNISGKELTEECYIQYLREKYAHIYHL